MSRAVRHALLLVSCLAAALSPAGAQVRDQTDGDAQDQAPPPPPPPRPVETGRVAESAVGRAGQRQTRDQAVANIRPLGRVNSRIQNRVDLRIRNRIDRDYAPQGTRSPFATAEEQATRRRPPR